MLTRSPVTSCIGTLALLGSFACSSEPAWDEVSGASGASNTQPTGGFGGGAGAGSRDAGGTSSSINGGGETGGAAAGSGASGGGGAPNSANGGSAGAAGLGGATAGNGAGGGANPEAASVFIGTAFRLTQLENRSEWAYVADHAGMVVHPDNLKGAQPEIFAQVAPHFRTRQAIAERNSLPTAEDITSRIETLRTTYQFNSGIYFYFNGPMSSKTMTGLAQGDKLEYPLDPDWLARGELAKQNGAIALFGLTPHVVDRAPGGWSSPLLDAARAALNTFDGYMADGPAELWASGDDAHRNSVSQAIAYAHSRGKKYVYLLSSHGDPRDTFPQAQDLVRDLHKRNTVPDIWAIEDYTELSKWSMTPERKPDGTPDQTITGLAYWILEHAAGRLD